MLTSVSTPTHALMSSSPTDAARAAASGSSGAARRDTHATRTALVAAAIALLVVFGADRWAAARAEARARAEVRAEMLPRVDALRSAAIRGVSLLSALVSFTESRRDRAQFDAEFPTFAQGVFAERGLRALQFIERGRIVVVWPLPGNEAALGFDLTRHPDSLVRADLVRSMASTTVTFTGPVELVQGGLGVLVRQRVRERPGFPELASVVLDVNGLLAAAGIPDTTGALALEVMGRTGWIAGDPAGSAVAPETLAVGTGASFAVLAAPAAGWAAATAPARRVVRIVLALVVLAAALVGWLIGRRRDRLEGEMRRSSTALRLVMSANRLGGWEEEVRSGRVRWNPTMDDLLGGMRAGAPSGVERLLGALEPVDAARLRASMERARAGGAEEFLEEVRLRVAGGQPRWMLVLGGLVRDADARPARLVGVVADASEQRALEERVRHSQRLEALAKLAGGVAHDFNNLLGAIVGYAEFARARAAELPAADAEILNADIDQLVTNADRGARLTEQLSTFSRRSDAERGPLDVSAAAAELTPTLERLLAGRARLERDLAPGLPRVLMDAEQFAQVLINLVVNARDAMPETGTIRVRTSLLADAAARASDLPPGRWISVEVEDEGTGIPGNVRARIFEPYFTTKPIGSGTGLGLSVVHGIVDASGGSVVVRSVEGAGTTFLVLLPPVEGRSA
jgi:signal transduction histidine kinase